MNNLVLAFQIYGPAVALTLLLILAVAYVVLGGRK